MFTSFEVVVSSCLVSYPFISIKDIIHFFYPAAAEYEIVLSMTQQKGGAITFTCAVNQLLRR